MTNKEMQKEIENYVTAGWDKFEEIFPKHTDHLDIIFAELKENLYRVYKLQTETEEIKNDLFELFSKILHGD